MNEVTEQTEKIPYHKTTHFARIKDAVDDIYKRTSGTMPLTSGFTAINPNDLYRKVALALKEEGIIENLGRKDEPKYIWKSAIKLTESVYHRVYLKVRQYNRKYYDNVRAKIAKAEAPAVPEETVEQPVVDSLATVTPVYAKTLDVFTDQELWDELKARGFGFVEGKLSKTIILN